MVPTRSVDPVWSADSRWIAYAKRLDNLMHAVFVYNIESGQKHQLTDGFSDATSPTWDASGKYLYFFAGTNFGLNTGWLDMTSFDRPSTRGIYFAVLKKGEPSPLLPPKGDEAVASVTPAPRDSAAGAERPAATRPARQVRVDIDFDGINNRILALPVPERDYRSLQAGVEGQVFYIAPGTGAAAEGGRGGGAGGGGASLQRYNLREREGREFVASVQSYTLSADRRKMLVRSGANWSVVDSDRTPPAAGAGRVDVAALRMRVDPRAEFKQMFSEGWRFQRDYLYVDNMHGVDYEKIKALYAPLLEHVAHRSDFSYLLDWMGGEIAVGHSFVRGGDIPDVPNVAVGLLGADLEIANGRYRIARIYRGESWNPGLRSPLSEPGVEVNQGEYLLEVNGVALRAPESPYKHFEGRSEERRVGKECRSRWS